MIRALFSAYQIKNQTKTKSNKKAISMGHLGESAGFTWQYMDAKSLPCSPVLASLPALYNTYPFLPQAA